MGHLTFFTGPVAEVVSAGRPMCYGGVSLQANHTEVVCLVGRNGVVST
jgi:ABC-type branched-subunit amino acid transport system ATPase component